MRQLIILFILPFILTLNSFAEEKATKEILIDVRTPAEYNSSHIEGALNIPHDAIKDSINEITKDKNTVIKLYCKSGGRAGMAKSVLDDLGYSNVINEGGYEELKKRLEENKE